MSGLAYDLLARVRGKGEAILDAPHGDPSPVLINPRGDLLVAKGMPGVSDLVRMRSSYVAVGTAAAPSNAWPTTGGAAFLTLWNGEQENGKVYVIDSIGYYIAVAAAAAAGVGMAVCMGQGKKATVANDIAPKGLAGNAYRGAGLVDLNATVTADTFYPWGSTLASGITSTIGQAQEYPVDGFFVVPPGHYFTCGPVCRTATTITCRTFIRWHEVLLPVG